MSAADNKKLVQEMFVIAGSPDPAVRENSLFMPRLDEHLRRPKAKGTSA